MILRTAEHQSKKQLFKLHKMHWISIRMKLFNQREIRKLILNRTLNHIMILLVQVRSSVVSELPLPPPRQPLMASVMVAQQIKRLLVTAPPLRSKPPPKEPLSVPPRTRQPLRQTRTSREHKQNSNNSKTTRQELPNRSRESPRLKKLATKFLKLRVNKLTSQMFLNTSIKSSLGSLQLKRESISVIQKMKGSIMTHLFQNKIDFGKCLKD